MTAAGGRILRRPIIHERCGFDPKRSLVLSQGFGRFCAIAALSDRCGERSRWVGLSYLLPQSRPGGETEVWAVRRKGNFGGARAECLQGIAFSKMAVSPEAGRGYFG